MSHVVVFIDGQTDDVKGCINALEPELAQIVALLDYILVGIHCEPSILHQELNRLEVSALSCHNAALNFPVLDVVRIKELSQEI